MNTNTWMKKNEKKIKNIWIGNIVGQLAHLDIIIGHHFFFF